MVRTQKLKQKGRGERHSAAWGKRLCAVLFLATGMAFAQSWNVPARGNMRAASFRISSGTLELSGASPSRVGWQGNSARHCAVPSGTDDCALLPMQSLGGHLHAQLHMIKGAAFTIPVSALAALEADPEVASVTIDHPLNVMDDLTNGAIGVSAAWNSGFTGAGVGVAVIDSGINDSHPDLWNSDADCFARGLSPGLHWNRHHQLRAEPSMTFTVTARTSPASSAATATFRADITKAWLRASI